MARPAPADENSLAAAGERSADAARQLASDGAEGLKPILNYDLLPFAGMSITVGGLLLAGVVLLVTWFLSLAARRALARYGEKFPNANRASLYTITRLLQYTLLVVGLLMALSVVGIPVGKLAVFAGALGVGLGFGLQAIFSNFISGLILLFDKSLKVGDFVELESGVHGEVRDVKIRATRIVTNNNIDILVPNSEFVTGRVVNWTYRDVSRRVHIPFGVAYGSDKEVVKRAALEAAAEVPFTLEQEGPRKPQVWLSEFGDSSLNFELVVWLTAEATKRPGAVKAAYNWALHSALERHSLEIPVPQQDLHLRSLFGLSGEHALKALRLEADVPKPAPPEVSAPTSNDAVDDVERDVAEEKTRELKAAAKSRELDNPDLTEERNGHD